MRVITQNLSQVAADPDGYSLDQNYIADDIIVFDGALASANVYNGALEIDLQGNSVGQLVGFTTGLTGSVADVTIVGRNQFGNPITEVVTMPGASSAVESTEIFSFIESITIDGVATNLSVGSLAAGDQWGPWIPLDTYQNPFEYELQIQDVSGTLDAAIENTIQGDLLRNGPEPDLAFDEATPFDNFTATVTGKLVDPITALRLRINGTPSSGAVAILRLLQSGGGFR